MTKAENLAGVLLALAAALLIAGPLMLKYADSLVHQGQSSYYNHILSCANHGAAACKDR